jgi:uncharacterized membrane protein
VTPSGRRGSWTAVVVVLSVGFAVLAHAAIIDGVPPAVGAVLSLVPVGFFLLWLVRRSGRPVLGFAAVAAAAAALFFGWETLEAHFPDLFFVEHAGINLLLAIVFGRTLLGAREPLVSAFARIIHGAIPPEVERYTRKVTAAWTLFFASLFATSCALYVGGFLGAWSLLANILSPVLIAAMFVVEYAVRLRALPNWERVGILGGIRAFSRHFGAARFEAPR